MFLPETFLPPHVLVMARHPSGGSHLYRPCRVRCPTCAQTWHYPSCKGQTGGRRPCLRSWRIFCGGCALLSLVVDFFLWSQAHSCQRSRDRRIQANFGPCFHGSLEGLWAVLGPRAQYRALWLPLGVRHRRRSASSCCGEPSGLTLSYTIHSRLYSNYAISHIRSCHVD